MARRAGETGSPAPPALEVLQPGLFTTVQDLGRPGYRRWGLPPAGAADRAALQLANALVGNPPGAAGLEMTLQGARLLALQDLVIALTGAEALLTVNEETVPAGESVWVDRGSIVGVGTARRGCRMYLGVAGGIAVPPVLGSRSTYTPAALGGFRGRPLVRGDRLPVGPPAAPLLSLAGRCLPPELAGEPAGPAPGEEVELPCLPGPGAGWVTGASLARFYGAAYTISPASNRMGCRLLGPPLEVAEGELLSHGLVPGSIQAPRGGDPILVLVDGQTTGGYPVVAIVPGADLDRAGQLPPGARVRWRPVTLDEAFRRRARRDAALQRAAVSIRAGPRFYALTPAGRYTVELGQGGGDRGERECAGRETDHRDHHGSPGGELG